MTEGLLQAFVEEDFGYKHEGKNWGRAEEHSSLVVNEEAQRWYWNSENKGGDALAYLMQVRGLDKKRASQILEVRGKFISGAVFETEKEGVYITPYERLVDTLWELGKLQYGREYWYKRKLTDKTIDRYRLGFYDGWNLIPLYKDGVFVNFQCRRDEPEKRIKMWYKIPGWTPVLVNGELLQLVDTIFITEGPVDALLLTQEGIPAVSHTGGAGYWNDVWFTAFNRVKKIYYICDNDDAGRHAGKKVAQSLGYDRVLLYNFVDKKEKYDTGDFFKDGGTGKDFREMVEQGSKNYFEIGDMNGKQGFVRRGSKRKVERVYLGFSR